MILFNKEIYFAFIEKIQISIPHFPKNDLLLCSELRNDRPFGIDLMKKKMGEHNMVADNMTLSVQKK